MPVKSGGHTKWMFDVWAVFYANVVDTRTASGPQNFVTVVSEVWAKWQLQDRKLRGTQRLKRPRSECHWRRTYRLIT